MVNDMNRVKHRGRCLNGILLIDKPAGMTSNYILQRLKRLFGARKAGHTGALDPCATGLLPICFGEATKFSQFLLDADKSYWALACLGVRTNTSDADGEVIETRPWEHITEALVRAKLEPFRGTINQVPSMYSALKYKGQRLYRLARAGIEVPVKSRRVTVYKLELLEFVGAEVRLTITCSKGTYVRSLVEDLGQSLGCGAHVKQLRRLAAGPYTMQQMHTLAAIEGIADQAQGLSVGELQQQAVFNSLDRLLLPPDTAVSVLNAVQCNSRQIEALQQGKVITLDDRPVGAGVVRVYGPGEIGEDAVFAGLADLAENATLHAKRLMQTQVGADQVG
jgi:tRNA pseudouridine55 synthase